MGDGAALRKSRRNWPRNCPGSGFLLRLGIAFGAILLGATAGFGAPPLQVKIGYLHDPPRKGRLSLMDVPADNDGLAGAQLSIEDNNTTGQFINQAYSLVEIGIGDDEDPVSAIRATT